MSHYNIIVAEGGGAKVPYEMGVLTRLEEKGIIIKDDVKLWVGTSVGSVVGGLMCSGNKSAKEWGEIILYELPNFFKKRSWFFPVPMYNKNYYRTCYEKYVGKGILMKDLPIWLMTTSVDRCEPRTHYIKSWESLDGALPVTEAVIRSFSAPLYFGSTFDEVEKKVWIDGGMGQNNLPLTSAYIEALRQGWLKDGNTVHIFAVGSGRADESITYEHAKRHGIFGQTFDQIKKYMDVADGGMTHEMSVQEQVGSLQAVVDVTPGLTMQVTDWVGMPKRLDSMDNIKDRQVYYDKGLEDGLKIDPSLFKVKGIK